VLKSPVTISKEQTAAFRKVYPLNNRPVQPLNGRKVLEGGQ
jgi:carbonic anhydrase